ncbi:uncharacterized protein DNG_07494 [Cephalotrichum gorgonifer]|uniref:NTF2-like domain-containing protein n=1 Tax=Cephalotrichum gorgonifer TaxID=2041049 RepID=A0AAE8N3I3_9PEZI|nr:uncharacterized protein DNG_07494 [Cephalotrichum gorgonifer]
MRAFTLALLGLAGLVVAVPECAAKPNPGHGGDDHPGHRGSCVSRPEARDIADAYARLVGAFTQEDADKYLPDNFADYSESINTFLGKPWEAQTFDKAAFVASQTSGRLPPTPITVIGEPVVDCDRVAILWTSTFGKGYPSRGLTIVQLEKNDKGDGRSEWLMARWDVEFNSLTWAYDQGQYYCLFGKGYGDPSACGAPASARRRGLAWE